MHSVVEQSTIHLLNGPLSVHKCKRKEKFGCTGIFGSRIFTNIFSDVWTKQIENIKHSQSKTKVSGIEKIDYNIYAGII